MLSNRQVPAPTLLSVPAPVTAPVKFVLAPANPTCTVFPPTSTRPFPVNALSVPSVEKLTEPLPLTVTATVFVSAPVLAQANWPPLTSKFVLASVPRTVSPPPVTSVLPVYVLVPVNVSVPLPLLVSDPLPLSPPL